jgi:hypothetical protein
VCAYLKDSQRAAELYALLLPYDGRMVVVGGATACYGAVARYLGILATARSDWEATERHFQGAIVLDARMGAWPWLAHSQYACAAMLLQKGDKQDRDRAAALLAAAREAAIRMGMAYLAQRIEGLLASQSL